MNYEDDYELYPIIVMERYRTAQRTYAVTAGMQHDPHLYWTRELGEVIFKHNEYELEP